MVHLSLINFIRLPRIPGSLFRGKKRLVKKVTPQALYGVERQYELEWEVRR
jgi:hypothetical protein